MGGCLLPKAFLLPREKKKKFFSIQISSSGTIPGAKAYHKKACRRQALWTVDALLTIDLFALQHGKPGARAWGQTERELLDGRPDPDPASNSVSHAESVSVIL